MLRQCKNYNNLCFRHIKNLNHKIIKFVTWIYLLIYIKLEMKGIFKHGSLFYEMTIYNRKLSICTINRWEFTCFHRKYNREGNTIN